SSDDLVGLVDRSGLEHPLRNDCIHATSIGHRAWLRIRESLHSLSIRSESAPRCPGGYFGAGADRELGQDIADVALSGALRDNEVGGDFGIAGTLRHKPGHLGLARTQRCDSMRRTTSIGRER